MAKLQAFFFFLSRTVEIFYRSQVASKPVESKFIILSRLVTGHTPCWIELNGTVDDVGGLIFPMISKKNATFGILVLLLHFRTLYI